MYILQVDCHGSKAFEKHSFSNLSEKNFRDIINVGTALVILAHWISKLGANFPAELVALAGRLCADSRIRELNLDITREVDEYMGNILLDHLVPVFWQVRRPVISQLWVCHRVWIRSASFRVPKKWQGHIGGTTQFNAWQLQGTTSRSKRIPGIS